MSNVTPLPHRPQPGRETVAALTDTRGEGRALRVTWHHEPAPHGAMVLLSLWREESCVASFRLSVEDVPDLIDALRSGLAEAYRDATSS